MLVYVHIFYYFSIYWSDTSLDFGRPCYSRSLILLEKLSGHWKIISARRSRAVKISNKNY